MAIKRILSGVQPTGNLHLGNYLGAIRNWVGLQQDYECLFMLADLHAITVPQDPAALRKAVRETAAAFIACGIDPDKSAIFPQSTISAHSELAWILSCHTPLGWLNRMTQFKEKAKTFEISGAIRQIKDALKIIEKNAQSLLSAPDDKQAIGGIMNVAGIATNALEIIKSTQGNRDEAMLGLYSYPVLMAADILVYKATHVPVGEDQKQHLELCRDIAGAFNRQYKTEFFTLPEPVIMKQAARIMSLRDGTKKMSKSDESDYSRINLTDDADAIALKIKKAKSDMVEGMSFDEKARPEAANLLTIYAALKGVPLMDAVAECRDKNFSAFKKELTDVAVSHLAPITRKMRELLASPDYIDQVLAKGTSRAGAIASGTMKEVKDLVGLSPA